MQPESVSVAIQAQLGAGFATLYTPATQSKRECVVSRIHLANTTGGAITVRICTVLPGGTPTQANALLWDYSIAANAYVEFGKDLVLLWGVSLQASASVGASVTLTFAGQES
jgi:hypothetical protein